MKFRKQLVKDQPDWVCDDCGQTYSNWFAGPEYSGPSKHCATYHEGSCDVCGKTKSVTEARDFGYLKNGWRTINV